MSGSKFWDILGGTALVVIPSAIIGKLCYDIGKDVGEEQTRAAIRAYAVDNLLKYKEQLKEEEAAAKNETYISESVPETQIPSEREVLTTVLEHRFQPFKKAKDFVNGVKKGGGVIGQLIRNPDGTKIEAQIVNGKLHVDILPKEEK